MATLPDIDTSTVSYLGYYKATEHGVENIDPFEALTAGDLHTTTSYDNGWEGLYNVWNGRDITIRMKSDGWVVAYIDRTRQYDSNIRTRYWNESTSVNDNHLSGPWDIIDRWTGVTNQACSINNGSFPNAIESVLSQLSNWGSITFDSADVGLYNYEEETATNVTLLSAYHNGYNSTKQVGMQYTDSINILQWDCTGGAGWPEYNNSSSNVKFDGRTVTSTNNSNRVDTQGVIDVLADNTLAAVPNTVYNGTMYQNYRVYGRPAISHLALWN